MSETGSVCTGPIVVGVDGSPGSTAALAWAVAEARRRGVQLDVVAAWQYPAAWAEGFNDRWAEDEAAMAKRARQTAECCVQEVVGSDGHPPWIRVVTAKGNPATMLLAHSRDAGLLVLGRSRRGLGHPGLGSVTRICLHHASCPVTVVPGDVPARDRSGPRSLDDSRRDRRPPADRHAARR